MVVAMLLASAAAQADVNDVAKGATVHRDHRDVHIDMKCEIGSQYSVRPYRSAFLFERANGSPTEIGIGGGRLFIDGKEQTLDAPDHQRLTRMETEMRLLVPEMQKVIFEAVDIAFTALTEVARGLSSNPQETISSLEVAHRRVLGEMRSRPLAAFNEDAMVHIVKPILTQFVPQIVGGAVSSALKAAFSGEKNAKEFEARMNNMEHELDTRVDARAKALEPLAEAMCQRLHRIDDLDNALDYRLPGGDSLELLHADREHTD